MAKQGWYPDPGGQQGMYRYWDGQSWSDTLSSTPSFSAPPQSASSRAPGQATDPSQPESLPSHLSTQKRSAAPWILAVVGVLVVGLIVWFVISQISGRSEIFDPTNPTPASTGEVCPRNPLENERAEHPIDDRVYGGDLSYPRLGSPWSAVDASEVRLPFGRDVAHQQVLIHKDYQPGRDWVAGLFVGELYAGDGFYEPEKASEIVNRCIFGAFYHDALVTPETLRSGPYTVDGLDGWITETNLTFSIKGLPSTSELVIVIIVKTSAMSSSILFASIPNDAMQYKPDVDRAIADLRAHT